MTQDFNRKILSIIEADKDCDWDAIVNHRNVMQCYKFNSAVARALNRNGVEALLVGCHYPVGTPNCSNYYVLARDGDSGQVRLVDAWVNSIFDGMREPFVGTKSEAQALMKTRMDQNWDTNWNLKNIVISKYNNGIPQDTKERAAFRKRWGEFGDALQFDVPVAKSDGYSILDTAVPPSGNTMTLDDMNRYAAGRNMTFNYLSPKVHEEQAQGDPLQSQAAVVDAGAPVDDPKLAEAARRGHWFSRLRAKAAAVTQGEKHK